MPHPYSGPPELTPVRLLTSWTFDPVVVVVAVVLGALYAAGVWRAGRRGERWSRWRITAHGGGCLMVLLAGMSFLGVYQHTLVWVRAVQVMVLLMLAPLLFAVAKPVSLLLAASSPPAADRIHRVLASRPAKVLTFPLFPVALMVGTGFALYFSPWYTKTLTSGTANHVLMVELLVSGFPFFWTLMRVDPVPREYPYLAAVWIAFVEVAFDAALGLAVMLGHPLAAPYYTMVARPWGVSRSRDQALGGGALWFVGDLVGLPFLAALFRQMLLEDRATARDIDRQLDEEAAQRRAARAARAARGEDTAPESDGGPEMTRPWWWSDPVLARRYGRPLQDDE